MFLYPSSQVDSERLCIVMENDLSSFLEEKGYIRLIQCFLNPQLILHHPELLETGEEIDSLYRLFMPNKHQQIALGENISNYHSCCRLLHWYCQEVVIPFLLPFSHSLDQSDIDLCHSLANLVAIVLGCPFHTNLWYHLFDQAELHGTYMAGFMVGNYYTKM